MGGITNFLKSKSVFLIILQVIFFFVLLASQINGPSYKNSALLSTPLSNSFVFAQDTKSVAGWLPSWDKKRAFVTLKENEDVFDEVSPFWYDLSPQGNLVLQYGAEDKEILDYLRQKKFKVLPTVSNQFDGALVSNILNNASLRKTHIKNIVDKVLDFDYEGIDIDYESLFPKDRDLFSLFIKELASALHEENKTLAVSVHAKTYEPGSWSGNQAQDWKALGKYADRIRIMGYDYHWDTSNPGPIAPLSWLDKVVAFATTVIPKNKIVLGVPFYGYDWVGKRGEGLVYTEVMDIAQKHNVPPQWDKEAPAPWLKYSEGRTTHEVWFENHLSLAPKLDLVLKYDLRGIALWRLGGEDKENWTTIREKFSLGPIPKRDLDYTSYEIFVKFKEGAIPSRIEAINQEVGVEVTFQLFLEKGTLQLIRIPSDFALSTSRVVSKYAAYPEVEYAEVNQRLATLKIEEEDETAQEKDSSLGTLPAEEKISKETSSGKEKTVAKSKKLETELFVKSQMQANSFSWSDFFPLL